MYAVIFIATLAEPDDEYHQMATRLRELAISSYGCIDVMSVTQGKREITVSYWDTEQQILNWKQDSEHLAAQQLGHAKWYASYSVQVVEIKREYGSYN